MKKKLLVALSIIITVPVAFALCIILNGHYFASSSDIADYDNNTWMSCIDDKTLLIDIAIPGSHDAGTFNMNWLGRTQGYSVKNQLSMGARYFDLRVNKTDDGYYMYHAMFNGEKFEDVLNALTDFITENKTETLILDFQHFSGGSEDDVISMLVESLVEEGLAVENTTQADDLEFVSTLRLDDVRGKCVILFGNEEKADEHDFLFRRNNDECTKEAQALNSCYISEYNKLRSYDFIETALPFYYQNIKDKIANEGFKGFFVLQGQLTDGYLIFGPYSKEKAHDLSMTEYISEIKEDAERLSLTNIIMRDFLTTEKCEDIIALNYYKGNVKEELADVFSAFLD